MGHAVNNEIYLIHFSLFYDRISPCIRHVEDRLSFFSSEHAPPPQVPVPDRDYAAITAHNHIKAAFSVHFHGWANLKASMKRAQTHSIYTQYGYTRFPISGRRATRYGILSQERNVFLWQTTYVHILTFVSNMLYIVCNACTVVVVSFFVLYCQRSSGREPGTSITRLPF